MPGGEINAAGETMQHARLGDTLEQDLCTLDYEWLRKVLIMISESF